MPTLPLYQVDAFSDRPFAGNPAAVCPLQAPLPDAVMQDIANENNLSETAFFLPEEGGQFHLRWFTPTVEVDLCGHATLASGFVLMTELEPSRREAQFRTRSGVLAVRRAEGDEYILDLPALPPVLADANTAGRVARALGATPAEVLRAPNTTLVAVLETEEQVRRAAPDIAAVAAFGTSLCITAPGQGGTDFVSRYFAPAHGIAEDPVTGSAHGFLTPYWAARLEKLTLRARQVSRRGGALTCTLTGDRVQVGGHCHLVLTGTLKF